MGEESNGRKKSIPVWFLLLLFIFIYPFVFLRQYRLKGNASELCSYVVSKGLLECSLGMLFGSGISQTITEQYLDFSKLNKQ